MKRPNRKYQFSALETFETRIVPTVTPLPGVPFLPPGLAVPPQDNAYIPPNVYTAITITPTTPTNNTTDTISFTLRGGVPGQVVTLAIFRSPGGGENAAAQKLAFSTPVTVTADANTAPGQTVTLDIASILGKSNNDQLHLTGQRHFQVDFYVNAANPFVAIAAPEKLAQPGYIQSVNGNFIFGQLFDYEGKNR